MADAVRKTRIEQFLDEVASSIYALESKYSIRPEDVHLDIKVRTDEFITNDEVFKNVRNND